MNKRARLLEKIKNEGFPEKEVFVTIKDFFDGNSDEASIGANIYPDPPSLQQFYKSLKEIEDDARTEHLLVRIADIDDTEWFYADTIYISGDYTLAEVKAIFQNLQPDEVYEGLMYNKASNIPRPQPGNKGHSVWWD